MKFMYYFLVVVIVSVTAQRRPVRLESSSAEPPTPRSITNRGRAKFTSSPEFAQIAEISDSSQEVSTQRNKPTTRRRLDYERNVEPRTRIQEQTKLPSRRDGSYEVQEVIDDIPRENVKRPVLRPKVIQEVSSTTEKVTSTTKLEISTEEEKINSEGDLIFSTAFLPTEDIVTEQDSLPTNVKLFNPESNKEDESVKEVPRTKTTKVGTSTEEPKRFLTRNKTLKAASNAPAPVYEESQRVPTRSNTKSRTNVKQESSTAAPNPIRSNFRTRTSATKSEPTSSTTSKPVVTRTRPPVVVTPTTKIPEQISVEVRPGRRSELISQVTSNLETNFRNHDSVIPDSNFRTRSNVRKRPLEPLQHENNRRLDIQQKVTRLENEFVRSGPLILPESEYPISRTSRKVTNHRISKRIDTGDDYQEVLDSKIEAAQSRRRETIVAAENQRVLVQKEVDKTTEKRPITRNSRLRSIPNLDESKLEVLPLFESDHKTEKSTAVDSLPEITKRVLPDSTTPLSKSKNNNKPATTPRSVTSRRIPSRSTVKEVKNNKLEPEVRGRSNRRHPASSTTPIPSRLGNRNSRANNVSKKQEASTIAPRGRSRHQPEPSTTQSTVKNPRRKPEITRNRPKEVKQNIPESRLQTLSPRRSNRPQYTRRDSNQTSTTTSTTIKPRITSTSAPVVVRTNSRFNTKTEDDLLLSNPEQMSESNVSKSVKKFEEVPTTENPKITRYTKRGTTKDNSELSSSEETIDESDNYPEPFKALIQAKLKNKESRSRGSEDSTDRVPNIAVKSSVTSTVREATNRDRKKEEENELNPLNSLPSSPKPQPRRTVDNKVESSVLKPTTPSPPSTSTTKEVLTSVSSKITRQRYHARFKAESNNNKTRINNLNKNSTVVENINNNKNKTLVNSNVNVVAEKINTNKIGRSTVAPFTRGKSGRNLPAPKAATGLYSSKKSQRSTTPVPRTEIITNSNTVLKRGGNYASRTLKNQNWENSGAYSEAPTSVKPKANRYSAKYRSDILRATGFKTSTIPAYVPTVPTVTPYVSTSTSSGVVTEENELGMEIISLDEPNKVSIPSANLIRDDYLMQPDPNSPQIQSTIINDDENVSTRQQQQLEALSQTKLQTNMTKVTNQVSNITNRKPVSVNNLLETILNAITSTTTNSPLRNPTIFSTTTLKPTTININSPNSITSEQVQKRTIINNESSQKLTTTENAVSIFEQIIESLTQNSTIPTTSTTPKVTTSTTTTTTIRPISTTYSPDKRTTIQRIPPRKSDANFGTPQNVIENILNSLSSIRSIVETTTSRTPSANSAERVVIITKPTEKAIKPSSNNSASTTSTTKRTVPTDKSGQRSVTILSTLPPTSTLNPLDGFLRELATENSLQKRTLSDLISLLNIANVDNNTADVIATSENLIATSTVPTTSTTEILTTFTTEVPTSTLSSSTVPSSSETMITEITSNTPSTFSIEEMPTTSKNEALMATTKNDEATVTSDFTTSGTLTAFPSTVSSVLAPNSFNVDINSVSISSANDISEQEFETLHKGLLAILNGASTTDNTISDLPFDIISTTKSPNMELTTLGGDMSSTVEASTITVDDNTTPLDISSNTIESSQSNSSSNASSSLTPNVMLSSRINTETPSNSSMVPLQSTVSPDKDYFLFAILPNNTVVRKKPSMYPTKETPYLIVGIYPNNTIVRKFPNGTLVPEEPVIQVNGFDTRENPPDLTSNQVTPDRGTAPDDNTLTTDNESSSVDTQTSNNNNNNTTSNGIPDDVELLNGKTVSDFNNVLAKSTAGSVKYKTLDVDPLTNQVRTTRPGELSTPSSGNTVFRWKPVTATPINEVSNKINTDFNVVGSASSTTPNIISSTTKQPMSTSKPQTTINIIEQMRANLRAAIQISPTTQKSANATYNPISFSSIISSSSSAPTSVGTTDKSGTNNSTTFSASSSSSTSTTTKKNETNKPMVSSSAATTKAPLTTMQPAPFTTTIRIQTTSPQITTIRVVSPPRPFTISKATTTTTKPTTTTTKPTTTTTKPTTTTTKPTTTTTKPTTTTIKPTTTTTKPTTTTTKPTTTTRVTTTTTTTTIRPSTVISRAPRTTSRPITTTTRIPTTSFRPTEPPSTTESLSTILNRRGSRRFRVTTDAITTTQSMKLPPSILLSRLQTVATTEAERYTVTPSVEVVTITPEPSTTKLDFTTTNSASSTKKTLTEEQKKNLETLAELEKEQAAILKQLSFLTNLIPGGPPTADKSSSTVRPLRESATTTNSVNEIYTFSKARDTTSKRPSTLSSSLSTKSVKSDSQKQLDELLKQYDLQGVHYPTTTINPSVTLPYGKSNDAILAALLKNQGIQPNTPKLELFEQLQAGQAARATTTTPRPGMIMQGLTWLLNRFAPLQQRPSEQPTRPRVVVRLPEVYTEEIMTKQPTKLTPVIYDGQDTSLNSIPSSTYRPRSANQDLELQEQREIAYLLKQIQAIQKDPVAAQNIVKQFTGKPSATYKPGRKGDLTPQELVILLKEVQSLQNDPKAVKNIKAAIQSEPVPTSTRLTTTTTTTRRPTTRKTPKSLNDLNEQELSILLKQIQAVQQNPNAPENVDLSTLLGNTNGPSLIDANNDDYNLPNPTRKPKQTVDLYSEDATRKPALPPVAFRPVNGIPDGDSQFRGRLVNAAVSVTRAISSFLGSAIQAMATRFLEYIHSPEHSQTLSDYYKASLDLTEQTPTEQVITTL